MRGLICLLLLVITAAGCGSDTTSAIDAAQGRDAAPGMDANTPRDSGTPDAVPLEDAAELDATEPDADPADTPQNPDAHQKDATEADAEQTDADQTDADQTDAVEPCIDTDNDGRGPGCVLGPDCDPQDNAAFQELSVFADSDEDSATVGTATLACTGGTAPDGFTTTQGFEDCNDADPTIYPGAAELSDCIDQDCDGITAPIGDGRDGELVATATSGEAIATEIVATTTITDTELAVVDGSGFAAGDLILILGVYGPDAGKYVVRRLTASSSVSLSVEGTVGEIFRDTTWVVRIAQYENVRVPSGVIVRPRLWPQPGGGVIAWAVSGRLTVEMGAEISASGACYGGGSGGIQPRMIGEQGASYSGAQTRARAANYSGGGGGSSPSLTNACGGGGGHATAGGMGQNHPGFNAAGGFGGGTVGTSSVTHLFCGGGGGGGGLDADPGPNSRGGNGGAGGGVVFLMVNELELLGRIRADGGDGRDGIYFGAASPGGGGGGAGGTIFVSAATVSSSIGDLSAEGGLGGRGSEAGGGNYRGGTGGAGRIRADISGIVGSSPPAVEVCQ